MSSTIPQLVFRGHSLGKSQTTCNENFIIHDKPMTSDLAVNVIRQGETPSEIASFSDAPLVELHYIWCDKSYFQFRHFLAIYSAVRKFRPQIVHFHATRLPPSAPHVYEWYEDIKKIIPLLELHETAEANCTSNQMPNASYLQKLTERSEYVRHVIVQEDVVVNSRFGERLNINTFVVSNTTAAKLLSILNKTNAQFIRCLSVDVSSLLEHCEYAISPLSICDRNLTNEDVCIHFANNVFARDVPQSYLHIASFIRYNYYGSPTVIRPIFHESAVIPKIGHYVYLGSETVTEKELNFEFYMSIISLLGIAKVNCVYIHGTVKFKGKFWNHLMKKNMCVRWHYWPLPKHVWQQPLSNKIAHLADIIRAQIFMQYGGLHMDPDAFFIHPLPDHYWHYEAIVGLDAYFICPGVGVPKELKTNFNLGVCLSMPGSRFFAKYQEAQKAYHDSLWSYNSGGKPSQIFDRFPELVYLNSKLHVVCAGGKCCPSWAKTEQEARHLSENFSLWFNETYAIHTVWPAIKELSNPNAIRASTSNFGHIANHILASNNVELSEIENL